MEQEPRLERVQGQKHIKNMDKWRNQIAALETVSLWGGTCMLRSSMLVQPRMLNPCSLAKCNMQMKHKWGEISSSDPAALQSFGKQANTCLKDTVSSSCPFNKWTCPSLDFCYYWKLLTTVQHIHHVIISIHLICLINCTIYRFKDDALYRVYRYKDDALNCGLSWDFLADL